ncbi:MAG: dUTP diphosphatase [Sphingomonadaceae bacterium]|nr:dUTP diphosphatase [Sphingomonadaceae bacterium]
MSVRVEVRVLDERLHGWGLPAYQSDWAAGIDLRACVPEPLALAPGGPAVLVPSGLAVAMPSEHMVAFVLARSGLGHRNGVVLGQAVGTIDADYHGEIMVSVWLRPGAEAFTINPGDRIAQLVFLPVLRPEFALVETFSGTTTRGSGGFGSTGVA